MSKLFVPADIMEKMVCLTCKKHLSVFPIYTKTDGSGGICGRCPIPNPDKYVRDEAFENIAQFLIFPCMHDGCRENMTPSVIEQHESCCIHRIYECPSKSYSKCDWKGVLGVSGRDLKSHFQEKHPHLFLTTPNFELSFTYTIEENMVFSHRDELFIVKKEIDAHRGLFFCSVNHLKSNEKSDSYMYFLRCQSSNKDYCYRSPEKATNCIESTKLTLEHLQMRLHDPAVIIVNVEIVEGKKEDTEENNMLESSEPNKRNPDVQWEMLSELECPICFEYMLPPIYQCIKGHSICGKCKARVRESGGDCPSCREPFQNTQNFSMERLSQLMVYPCKFHKTGCGFISKGTEIRLHEDGCEYGPYECPLKDIINCEWKASSSKVLEHVSNNHDENIQKLSKIQVPFVRDETCEEVKLIASYKRIFKIFFIYQQEKFYWIVQLVGPTSESKKYKFEIDIVDLSGEKKRFFLMGHVAPLDTKIDTLNTPGMYLVATLEQLEGFIRSNFSFRIKVVKS